MTEHLKALEGCIDGMVEQSTADTLERIQQASEEQQERDALALIERSSLGTLEAKTLREQAPKHAVDAVLRRVDALEAEKRIQREQASFCIHHGTHHCDCRAPKETP